LHFARRPARHVFLSPHYDDIALSGGGTAALAAQSRGKADVALIFGDHPGPTRPLTDFAESLHTQQGMDGRIVIAARRLARTASVAPDGGNQLYPSDIWREMRT
jgi:hypothetical protein